MKMVCQDCEKEKSSLFNVKGIFHFEYLCEECLEGYGVSPEQVRVFEIKANEETVWSKYLAERDKILNSEGMVN